MKKTNISIVYHQKENKILMCYRTKNPYLGKYNLVGGKLETEEDELSGAYRELYEETGITDQDIHLTWIMNFQYKLDNLELEVFAGKLNKEVKLKEEINPLCWISLEEDFSSDQFAGEGNIQYMLNYIDEYFKEIKE